jgi:hypothetical protein
VQKIGNRYPEARADSVAALMAALENYSETDPILNASIVKGLADLDAVEAAPLVEQAFQAEQVDEMLMGDWDDFQSAVGLLDEAALAERKMEKQKERFAAFSLLDPEPPSPRKKARTPEEKKQKKKHKQARQSRKQNRRRK